MKKTTLLAGLLLPGIFSSAQKDDFKDGYALRVNDTIQCRLKLMEKHGIPHQTLVLLINDEQSTFFPGGPITGFGIQEEKEMVHYGTVDVERTTGDRRTATLLYLKKSVAGKFDFYEYTYSVSKTTTKTITRNGIPQPGSNSFTITTTSTSYYISKNDTANPVLAKPALLPSLRKSDLEIYFADSPAILGNMEKKFSFKEFIAFLKKYNNLQAIEKAE